MMDTRVFSIKFPQISYRISHISRASFNVHSKNTAVV